MVGMKALGRLAPLFLAMLIALAPAIADAQRYRGSFGSRGSHTYSAAPGTSTSPFGAAPIQRSYTPNGGASSGYANPGYANPGYAGGMRPRSVFASGLMGGLIGAGLGGMLFGGGFFGGMHGGGSILGLLLQLFLLYMLGSWLYRRFFAGNPALAGGGTLFGRGFQQGGMRPMAGGGGRPAGRPVALSPADYQSFDALLHNVQAAWSAHDLPALQAITTPEMTSFFAEQLAEQTSRGVRNSVTNVQLQKGDLSEAWSEGNREYATVAMRFSMIDVTRDGAGRVVDGSLSERVTTTEVWTFLRASGGRWVLSAIQQTN